MNAKARSSVGTVLTPAAPTAESETAVIVEQQAEERTETRPPAAGAQSSASAAVPVFELRADRPSDLPLIIGLLWWSRELYTPSVRLAELERVVREFELYEARQKGEA